MNHLTLRGSLKNLMMNRSIRSNKDCKARAIHPSIYPSQKKRRLPICLNSTSIKENSQTQWKPTRWLKVKRRLRTIC
eukprot:scaffold558400_cov130-Attheya_sp.AAC.1